MINISEGMRIIEELEYYKSEGSDIQGEIVDEFVNDTIGKWDLYPFTFLNGMTKVLDVRLTTLMGLNLMLFEMKDASDQFEVQKMERSVRGGMEKDLNDVIQSWSKTNFRNGHCASYAKRYVNFLKKIQNFLEKESE